MSGLSDITGRTFIKMHGAGNDFVILDGRAEPCVLSPDAVRAIADRRLGVGCDQVIVLAPAQAGDVAMRIWNGDGGEVAACGNASRCVARLVMAETGRAEAVIETAAGLLRAARAEDGTITIDMGTPKFDWREIPLRREMDTLHVDLARGPLSEPVAVNVGNPHAVFFVDDAEAIDLAGLGPALEHDPLFPERANISVATVIAPNALRLRVWERGAGLTRACGTAACAALVAGVRRGLLERAADIRLDGGTLRVEWRADDDHLLLSGPAAESFRGALGPDLGERRS